MKYYMAVSAFVTLCLVNGAEVMAHKGAGFDVSGEGATLAFDPQSVPAKQKQGYAKMLEHCIKCHDQERIVKYLQNCPTNGQDGEKLLQSLIAKKVRMTGANLTREEGKSILEFLVAMYQTEVKAHRKIK
jgi:cytochrome c553